MEWLWACSILLVILAVPVAMTVALVRLYRRVGELDRRLREQSARLERAEISIGGGQVVAEATPAPAREVVSSEASESAQPPEPVEIPPGDVGTDTDAGTEAEAGTDTDPDTADSTRLWGGLEEAIWTRLPVWIGAAALALAAAYLVKLGIDHGWIGPGVRVGAGMAFGGALLVAGEILRRSSSYVAQGLSAAGVAALYVSSYAAVELYQLVPPAAGFALMAATTAAAVALSLRQGYVVATVGLVGGFLTPSLLAGESRSAGTLFVYLLLLQIGLLVVVRKRRWASLGLVTAVAGLLWVVAVLSDTLDGTDALWTGLFLVGSTVTFLAARLLDAGREEEPNGSRLASSLVGWAATGGGLLASGVLASRMEHGALEWTFVGLLALACLAAARLDETRDDRLHGLAWLASVLVAIFFAAWLADPDPADARRALLTLAALGTLLTAGAWAAHLGSRRPGAWASLVASLPVVFLLLTTEGAPRLGLDDFPGGGLALALAFAVLASAVPVHRRREQAASGSAEHGAASRALAALAAGTAALVALAVPLELEREWLAVAWALQIPALLWLADRLEVGTLRAAAGVIATGVAVRLLLNPGVLTYPVGETPIWNLLLWGYGVPIAAVIAASILAENRADRRLVEGLRALAIGLVFVFLALESRHLVHEGDLDASTTKLVEWGGWIVAWLGLAWGLARLAPRLEEAGRGGVAARWGARLVLGAALFAALVGPALFGNPLFEAASVGETPIWNALLFVYGVPIPLFLLAASAVERLGASRDDRARVDRWLARAARVGALVEAFLLVTAQVRQYFHGDRLHWGLVSTAEQYAYSIAWIVLGSLLAVGGVVLGGRLLRYGSLAVLLPAVVKVFVFDTSGLDGLWRVASLFGLGVCLFALAWIYQRFVFRRPGDSSTLSDSSD